MLAARVGLTAVVFYRFEGAAAAGIAAHKVYTALGQLVDLKAAALCAVDCSLLRYR
jgi:hypothetical protein